MMDTNLCCGPASAFKLVENLSVDHCAARLQQILAEEISPVKLKSAVHIAYFNLKQGSDKEMPAPGVEFAHKGVLAVHTIPQNGIVLFNQGKERGQILQVELTIGVCEKSQIFGDSLKTRHQGSPVALIDGMGNQTYTRIGKCNRLNNGFSVVLTTIVDNNDLEIRHPGCQSYNC